jgi:two-component system, cell cycle sensor histidine kinase and response regulator CckA
VSDPVAELTEALRRERDEHERTARVLELVLRQMPGTYWVVDRDLRILQTGGAIEQVLGYPADRFLGQTLHDAIAADPSSGDIIATHRRALDGELAHEETVYRDKVMANTIGPYRAPSGEIIGAIGTSIDVTAWRQLERRMVDAQRAESLGVLAGGLAHDFNNLLVAVLGNADLALRELPEGKPGRTAIENIRVAGLRAAELTDQLLAYAGRGVAGTAPTELAPLLDELLRLVAPTIPPEVRVNVTVPTSAAVRADPAQMRQVLMNLINNGRDALAGTGGTIAIRAGVVQLDGESHPTDVLTPAAGTYLHIEVHDDGPGIPCETLRHVFEPFFTTKQTGHGLGLAAVLGIVRAHAGGIRVTSTPGEGTTIQILWPAAFDATAAEQASTPIIPPTRTVLIVDDELLVRDVMARMIHELGYATLTAPDGQTALDLLDARQIDAVVVDLTMPRMSGAEVVAQVRARRPGLPIVVCSGYDREGRGPVQADAYLPKPFPIDALERTLARLLPLRNV